MLCCQMFRQGSMIARNVGSFVLDIVTKVQCLGVLLLVLFLALLLFSAYSAPAIVIPTISGLLPLFQSYCYGSKVTIQTFRTTMIHQEVNVQH